MRRKWTKMAIQLLSPVDNFFMQKVVFYWDLMIVSPVLRAFPSAREEIWTRNRMRMEEKVLGNFISPTGFRDFLPIQGGFKHANEETQSCGSRRDFGSTTTGWGLHQESGCTTAATTTAPAAAADSDRNLNR
jgi:hypothetical protein